jgi:hypothetical protein
VGAQVTNLLNISDESLRAYYESVRRQVAADTNFGGRHRLVGAARLGSNTQIA